MSQRERLASHLNEVCELFNCDATAALRSSVTPALQPHGPNKSRLAVPSPFGMLLLFLGQSRAQQLPEPRSLGCVQCNSNTCISVPRTTHWTRCSQHMS
jgi:hypothetical protein